MPTRRLHQTLIAVPAGVLAGLLVIATLRGIESSQEKFPGRPTGERHITSQYWKRSYPYVPEGGQALSEVLPPNRNPRYQNAFVVPPNSADLTLDSHPLTSDLDRRYDEYPEKYQRLVEDRIVYPGDALWLQKARGPSNYLEMVDPESVYATHGRLLGTHMTQSNLVEAWGEAGYDDEACGVADLVFRVDPPNLLRQFEKNLKAVPRYVKFDRPDAYLTGSTAKAETHLGVEFAAGSSFTYDRRNEFEEYYTINHTTGWVHYRVEDWD